MERTEILNFGDQTFVRPNEQIGREELARLARSEKIERVERGIYRNPQARVSEYESLILASHIVQNGVICLLSALRFHDLTTQEPFEIWMALKPHAHRPKADTLNFRFVHFSGKSFTEGVEEYEIGGARIRVYGVAKTLADCFKFRNKIGLDICLEALREAREKKLFTMDELWRFAKICRVQNVMRPYLETL